MKKKTTKKQQKTPKVPTIAYDALDDKDKLMVDMVVNGYPLKIVAEKVKLTYDYVGHLFIPTGKLYKAYKERYAIHRKEMDKGFEQINQLIKDGAALAVLKEIEAVKASGTWPGTMMAAKDLLSRAGFDATEKHETTIKTDEAVLEAAEKLQEYAKRIDTTN